MSETINNKEQSSTPNNDALLAFSGLRAALKVSAFLSWDDAFYDPPDIVDVAVASVNLDDSGSVVAFGVRYSELLNAIVANGGRIDSPSARQIACMPQRVVKFSIAGDSTWPPIERLTQTVSDSTCADPYDLPPY